MIDREERHSLRFVSATADLAVKCAQFLEDSRAATSDKGLYTYYAVDADVVMVYLEPDTKSNRAYADVLGIGDTRATRDLSFLLGDFMFRGERNLLPVEPRGARFLLVNPHHREVLRQVGQFYEDLRIQISVPPPRWSQLSAAFAEFEVSADLDKLSQTLYELMPDLIELHSPYRGPLAAIKRFGMLDSQILGRIDEHREGNFKFPILDSVHRARDRIVSNGLRKNWETRLKEARRRHRGFEPLAGRLRNLESDAEVLAVLEHVNECLAPDQRRLVLVTGAPLLFRAAETYVPPWSGEERTFADLYLRHPRSFLAHDCFFLHADDSEPSFKLGDWLGLLFVSETSGAKAVWEADRNRLRQLAVEQSELCRQTASAVARSGGRQALLDEWQAQVAALAKAQYAEALVPEGVSRRGARSLAQTLRALRASGRWSPEGFKSVILVEAVLSVSRLYETTVMIGLWSSISTEDARGVPALRLRPTLTHAVAYRDAVVKAQIKYARTRIPDRVLGRLVVLNRRLAEADPDLYYLHVVHALAFAAKGQWYAALTLAKMALDTARKVALSSPRAVNPQYVELRKGREAAYLACVVTRRSSIDVRGLMEAEAFLDKAIQLDELASGEDVRFAAERLALSEKRLNFDLFCSHLCVSERRGRDLLQAHRLLLYALEAEHDEGVVAWVTRQTLTNYLSVLLVGRHLGWELDAEDIELAQIARRLRRVLRWDEANSQSSIWADPWAYLMCDVWEAYSASDMVERDWAVTQARRAIEGWREGGPPYRPGQIGIVKNLLEQLTTDRSE